MSPSFFRLFGRAVAASSVVLAAACGADSAAPKPTAIAAVGTQTLAGPVGTLIGAAVGAVLGGMAGSDFAAMIDLTAEDDYWRENFAGRSYVETGASYAEYGPAYAYGVDSFRNNNQARGFDDAEPDLSNRWEAARGSSKLDWQQARHAARDAWNRLGTAVERALPGDSNRNGF